MPKIRESKHPYLQISEHYRKKILDGTLAPGSRVPSLREIAKDWSVSPVTASKAMTHLQAEGYVTVGGKGLATTVRDPKEVSRNGKDRAIAVRRTGRIYTPGEYARITSAEVVPAPDDIASALGLAGAEPSAIRRVRITYGADHQPVSASVSWYDSALAESAPKLLEAERIVEGSWGYVEKQTGQLATRGQDQITTRLATEEDAVLLGLELPAAVKVSTTTLWTEDGTVVEYGVSVSGPARYSTYEYDLHTDKFSDDK
ncbi:GntR family transcriptional regulator [Streptomyces sp. NPDC053705]|uniref:GntR family transcriptional regulator n=1 Tax=Streptomyces sp. NPDC053705 TaxID=3156668 RepID=UPI00341FFDC2